MKIKFLFQIKAVLNNRKAIKVVIKKIFSDYKVKFDFINIIICTDEYLRSINQKYLKHDYYTDIITFDLSDTNHKIGEMYISLDRVKENARSLNIIHSGELNRVIIHGILHLVGLKDKNIYHKTKMNSEEDKYLKYL